MEKVLKLNFKIYPGGHQITLLARRRDLRTDPGQDHLRSDVQGPQGQVRPTSGSSEDWPIAVT